MNKKQNDIVYIMSPSYSGSTLLTFLLASHSKVATVGELKATAMGDINKYICSCGEQLANCKFWKTVYEEMKMRNSNFSFSNFGTHFKSEYYPCDRMIRAGAQGNIGEFARRTGLILIPRCRKELKKTLEQNKDLIDIIANLQNADVFLDGSKDPIRVRYLMRANYWNVRIIFLVRDGRGVANSYMKHNETSMAVAAKEWVKKCREMNHVAAACEPRSVLKIKYENLCLKPDHIMESIFNFLNIDISAVTTNYREMEHHILGNAMRLQSSSEIKLDQKWKNLLGNNELTQFERIAGKMNRRFGYE